MTPLQTEIERLGGLIKTAEIHRMGIGRRAIESAVRTGEIERVRQAWYANPWLPVPEKHAARVGGQLACASAAAALGLWEPKVDSLHVCVDPNDTELRTPTSYRTRLGGGGMLATVHWSGIDPLGTRVLVSPTRCIRQLASCASDEVALAVAESALHRRLISDESWDFLLETWPRRIRRLLAKASALSESGSESVFVYKMARAGVIVVQQVVIPGVGRVDGLIGERLIVEIDSYAFHRDPLQDRHRDALLSALGYRVLRFMYSQVMYDWAEVEAAVLAAISRGDHLA